VGQNHGRFYDKITVAFETKSRCVTAFYTVFSTYLSTFIVI